MDKWVLHSYQSASPNGEGAGTVHLLQIQYLTTSHYWSLMHFKFAGSFLKDSGIFSSFVLHIQQRNILLTYECKKNK